MTFHQSHLKGKQNYGHQAAAVMLSCNGIENAVVLISYPKGAFHAPKAPRAFISTDVSLSIWEILDRYAER